MSDSYASYAIVFLNGNTACHRTQLSHWNDSAKIPQLFSFLFAPLHFHPLIPFKSLYIKKIIVNLAFLLLSAQISDIDINFSDNAFLSTNFHMIFARFLLSTNETLKCYCKPLEKLRE